MPISSAPLAKKLMLKPGMRGVLLDAPKGFALAPPPGVTLSTRAAGKDLDFGLAFARDSARLAKVAPKLVKLLREDAIGWIAWPKKTGSIETDLSRDADWSALWDTGWEGVSLVSLDEDWSAWRIRPSTKVKRTPEAQAWIAKRDAALENARANPVDAYLAALPAPHRAALEKLRAQIRAAAPDVVEVISYGIPTFRRKGKNLVHMAAFKAHLSFFPGRAAMADELRDALEGYRTSKGTIQFTVEKPLPAALVKRIVKLRVAEQDRR